MRLDKYIASVTDYSRTEVKRFIKHDRVWINDLQANDPGQHIKLNQDSIRFDGEILGALAPRYFMLNKPKETVCATEDSEHPTVIDLLDEPNSHKLHIAGRLDKDTTGLVLITDDGQWNHQITSPKKQCFKIYDVTLAEAISTEAIRQLEQGVQLHQEKQLTMPATVTVLEPTRIRLGIQEGKYHQVKRMLAAVNNHVTALHRLQVGEIVLDTTLDIGEYRSLTPTEISSVIS